MFIKFYIYIRFYRYLISSSKIIKNKDILNKFYEINFNYLFNGYVKDIQNIYLSFIYCYFNFKIEKDLKTEIFSGTSLKNELKKIDSLNIKIIDKNILTKIHDRFYP